MDVTGTFYGVADDAIHGYGAELLVGDGATPETFQAVKGVTKITLGSIDTEDIDVTHLRSLNRHREHMAGMRDSGPIGLEAIWLPDDESQSYAGGGSGSFASGGMTKFATDGLNRNFIIRVISASPHIEWPVRGYVNAWQPGEIVPGEKISITGGIMPSGDYTAGLP